MYRIFKTEGEKTRRNGHKAKVLIKALFNEKTGRGIITYEDRTLPVSDSKSVLYADGEHLLWEQVRELQRSKQGQKAVTYWDVDVRFDLKLTDMEDARMHLNFFIRQLDKSLLARFYGVDANKCMTKLPDDYDPDEFDETKHSVNQDGFGAW